MLLMLGILANAQAASTSIAPAPLITSPSTIVLPNVFLMMDDSGSMSWDFMPDDVSNFSGRYGYASSQCNGVYYNPNITYTPPVKADGTPLNATGTNLTGDSSFTAAWTNGYSTGSGTVNLSTSFSVSGFSAQPAFYYKYTGTQTTAAQKDYYTTSSTFYQECVSSIGSSPGSGVFTKVVVSSTSGPGGTDERTNFANWYSYYRTRILMMKTSTGLAFSPICPTGSTAACQYRVGFGTMNNNGGSKFLNLSTFDPTQKTAWYNMLYSTVASNSTPLLGALANVGKMYANKISSINGVSVVDPIQYSCQQNFAILTTDGFWNSTSGGTDLNGNMVGEQDGNEARPMYDGATTTGVTEATITVSGNSSTSVSSIKVNGVQILSNTTRSSTSSSTVASRIATYINYCTNNVSGNCTFATGYSATVSGSTVTITAPTSAGQITYTPVLTASGGMSFTISGFSTTQVASGGTSNTLSDVAEYYYKTDLRTAALGNNLSAAPGSVNGTDVSTNNVPSGTVDAATWQHMTTFTLGLGARGRMVYSPTYPTDTSGDFYAVKTPLSAPTCSWQTSGNCNWPIPNVSGTPENIDDLWHAAVDGRGLYFSATDPAALSDALKSALSGVSARIGAAAAATSSNPVVTLGDNYEFSSTFMSVDWTGELVRHQIDLTTGIPSTIVDWSAQSLLDAMTYTSRNIYMYSSTTTNHLTPFLYSNLSAAQQSYFSMPWISDLTQFCVTGANCLSSADQTLASGTNLVNFLRGDRSNEGLLSDTTKYYRLRPHVLGDFVDSEAVYVKGSLVNYGDPGYSAFKTYNSTRQGMVYIGSNDGMLHAFYAATGAMDPTTGQAVATGTTGSTSVTGGAEAWTYIPSMVLPTLYHLADKNYGTQHHYYVDGTPVVGDICSSNCTTSSATWKTILVGGLNSGGNGYYALDITNPAQPKLLWEFTDPNMGYTYGNPNIVKLSNGQWVVLVTSGYNNIASAPAWIANHAYIVGNQYTYGSSTYTVQTAYTSGATFGTLDTSNASGQPLTSGDGHGRLYVLDANSGTLVTSVNGTGWIDTGAGSTTTPSGLARIAAVVVNPTTDNTVQEVYGGDLLGNLWRFDVNNNIGATGYDAQLLVTLQDANGVAQPITERPEVGNVNGNIVVYVGTGRYLGSADVTATPTPQTMYAIKDTLGASTYGNPHTSGSGFIQQTITSTTCPAGQTLCSLGQTVYTSTNYAVDWTRNNGWYVDFPGSGERSTTDPTLVLGTLGFTTAIPDTSGCTVGGYGFVYFLNYKTGGPVYASTTTAPVGTGSDTAGTGGGTSTSTPVSTQTIVGQSLGNAIPTRVQIIRLPDGTFQAEIMMSDGRIITLPANINTGIAPTRRVSWRELISQ
jgi:type IV pilus assembly protein PilY1